MFFKDKLHSKSFLKKGHLANVCISRLFKNKIRNQNVHQIMEDCTEINVTQVYDVFLNDYHTNNGDDKMYATVKMDGVEHGFECDFESNVNQVYDVFLNDYYNNNGDDKMYATVKMDGVEHGFKCNSGSKVTIMNDLEFKRLKLNIPPQKTNVFFRSYTG